ELRASEEGYRALFEKAPDGIVVMDRDFAYIDANPSLCAMLGYTRGELAGHHTRDFVSERDRLEVDREKVSSGFGTPSRRDWQFVRKNGSIVETEFVGAEIPDGRKIALIKDVTDRKRAAED